MLKTLKQFLAAASGGEAAGRAPAVAETVATLLVKAAGLDGEFDAEEKATIERLMAHRFDLKSDEVRRLMARAEAAAAESVDLYGFTRVVRDEFDHEARVRLMEMLWEVAYADGELHDFEASLMRRVAGLVYVPDRESGEARKRVIAKLGLAEA